MGQSRERDPGEPGSHGGRAGCWLDTQRGAENGEGCQGPPSQSREGGGERRVESHPGAPAGGGVGRPEGLGVSTAEGRLRLPEPFCCGHGWAAGAS